MLAQRHAHGPAVAELREGCDAADSAGPLDLIMDFHPIADGCAGDAAFGEFAIANEEDLAEAGDA